MNSASEVEKASNDLLAKAIRRMRNGQVYVKEGFDGEFGKVKVFQEGENKEDLQMRLF